MADYVQPSDPSVGGPTKASLPASQNEGLSNLNARLATVESGELVNRSFESPGDTATEAAGWLQNEGAGGTISRIDTDSYHGEWSMNFNRTAGGGNNAGTLTSDLFTFAEFTDLLLGGYYKSTAALASKIEAVFLDEDEVVISTLVMAAATTIQTLWTPFGVSVESAGGTKFAKIILSGATSDVDVAGNALFDGLTKELLQPNEFNTTGEQSVTGTAAWQTYGTADVWVPDGAANIAVKVQAKTVGGESCEYRASIGGNVGSLQSTASSSYVTKNSQITVGSETGAQTITLEFRHTNVAIGTSYLDAVASGDLTEENIVVS